MITIEQAINRIAEKTYENSLDIRRKNLQRRHQVVDLYGVEYSRLGDGNNPAIVYISISPDMEYLERFQFKLIITPFRSSVGSMSGSGTASVGETELSIEHDVVATNIGGDDYDISVSDPSLDPNPHSHSIDGLTITATPGITISNIPSSAQFRVKVFDPVDDPTMEDAVDITEMLASQYNNQWISGAGVYPSRLR